MPGLLNSIEIDDTRRRENDRHRTGVVLAVLGVLSVYVYLFTQAAEPLGLPLPATLAWQIGVELPHVFDDDGNVESNVQVSMRQRLESSDDERLVLFAAIAAAFLCAYYLPLRYKQAALVGWTTLAIGVLYGPDVIAALLSVHLLLYLVLHPDRRRGAGRHH